MPKTSSFPIWISDMYVFLSPAQRNSGEFEVEVHCATNEQLQQEVEEVEWTLWWLCRSEFGVRCSGIF